MAHTTDRNGTDGLHGLLDRMSLDEKITLLAAKNIWETPEIERLGIPSLKVSFLNAPEDQSVYSWVV